MENKRRYFYSSESKHGSSSSYGFENDTVVLVWNSKAHRDRYVAESDNISVKPIKRTSVTSEATNWSVSDNCNIAPKKFSDQYWGITDSFSYEENGLVGVIAVCYPHDKAERLH